VKLSTKLVVLICGLLFLIILVLAYSFQQMWSSSLKDHIGSKALHLAITIASIPELQDAFGEPEPWLTIQPLVETIRKQTDAEFIVVGNRDGIRYSHPIPARIGYPMVGGDNEPVFRGESIISEARGTLGLSLRGKTPVYSDQGEIIGVVSVGFLIEDINDTAVRYRNYILLVATSVLLAGALGAVFIARNVKRSIQGLEPEEISRLYQEKEAILESIHEGIIAVNRKGAVTLMNQQAMDLIGARDKSEVIGRHILELVPESTLPEVIESGQAQIDQEAIVGEHVVIANRLPVHNQTGSVTGAVSSFRNKSELYLLTQQLSQLKQYADGLRAQTHEFSNKLYTISGLIQLESYQEALDFINSESISQRDRLHLILNAVPDPILGGLLLGKMNRAQELKVDLRLDPDSTFQDIPEDLDRNLLVTIVGNLIDNAMEAVLSNRAEKIVTVLLTDLGNDLIIEIEDNGPGVSPSDAERMFEVGYSSKQGNHRGFGLALVKKAIQQLSGSIEYEPIKQRGARFTVALPKGGEENDTSACR
jgi:two-component system CitB family sensor kinase